MQLLTTRLLLAFVPAILLLSSCGDAGAPADTIATASPTTAKAVATTSPVAVAVKPSAPAAPVAPPPAAPPPADPYAQAKAAGATAVCADGSWSYSKTRSGTCSSHGGVHWWTGNVGAPGPGAH
jgi:serine/threonine-protein kinase